MKSTAFHDALTSAKLLLVLGASPFGMARKETHKSVSRIRANIDLALVGLQLRGDEFAADDKLLETYLANIKKHLSEILGKLHPEAFILGQSHRSNLFRAGVSNITGMLGAQKFVLDLLKGIEALTPQAQSPKIVPVLQAATKNVARKETLKDFSSLVRNAEWLSMLAAIGVDPTGADAQKQVAHLTATLGSRTGKAQVAQRTARFVGGVAPATAVPALKRSTAATRKGTTAAVAPAPRLTVAEAAVIVVKLNPAVLVNHTRVRELSVDHPEVNPRVTDLLSAASIPVELAEGQDATTIAQGKLDEFFAGLDRREVAVKAARRKASQAAEKAQRDKAVDALKGINPQLLEVLKRNPELLQKA